MWFFGQARGVELIGKMAALQNLSGTKDTYAQLYAILSILDTKAAGLLTVNSLAIAGLVVLLGSPPEQIVKLFGGTVPPWVLKVQLAAIVISAFLCLLVIRVTWQFMGHVRNLPTVEQDFEGELRHLANVIDDRTHYYWFGWLLALAGFALTLAWWQLWYTLVALPLVALWAAVRSPVAIRAWIASRHHRQQRAPSE